MTQFYRPGAPAARGRRPVRRLLRDRDAAEVDDGDSIGDVAVNLRARRRDEVVEEAIDRRRVLEELLLHLPGVLLLVAEACRGLEVVDHLVERLVVVAGGVPDSARPQRRVQVGERYRAVAVVDDAEVGPEPRCELP